MIRFFADQQDISDSKIRLSEEDAEHIRALRLRANELFVVCNGAGSDHICRLSDNGDRVAYIVETRPTRGEPDIACSVYIALAKGDRLSYAVQKSVELGARDIVLFQSERCISIPVDMVKKTARLQRIAMEAAKQCGRGRIPEVTAINSFPAAIGKAASAALPLFLYECEDKLHLKQVLEKRCNCQTISIVSGPEGGFEPYEAELARSKGMTAVTLGPRILRCETVPSVVLAAIMFYTGNL